jgi:hypothetical protein
MKEPPPGHGCVPRSRAAHKKEKRGKNKPTARYLIDQYGEKGKVKKKPE